MRSFRHPASFRLLCDMPQYLLNVQNLGCAVGVQDLYHGFHPENTSSIFVFIAVFAAAQLLLSQLPTLRHLRHLNVVAVVCTAAFVVIVSTECIRAGAWASCSHSQHPLAASDCLKAESLQQTVYNSAGRKRVPVLLRPVTKLLQNCRHVVELHCPTRCRQEAGPQPSESWTGAGSDSWAVHSGGVSVSARAKQSLCHLFLQEVPADDAVAHHTCTYICSMA
jgi:hypothetical protein